MLQTPTEALKSRVINALFITLDIKNSTLEFGMYDSFPNRNHQDKKDTHKKKTAVLFFFVGKFMGVLFISVFSSFLSVFYLLSICGECE